MNWSKVGDFLKENGGGLLAVAGTVLGGPVGAGVATVASIVKQATGENEPDAVLEKLQNDPDVMVRLRKLTNAREADIRRHDEAIIAMEIEDKKAEHHETQETIRSGDNANDEYVRHTRPMMARQSWYMTCLYIIIMSALYVFGYGDGPSVDMAMILISLAWGYSGLRSIDKKGFSPMSAAKAVIGRK